MRLRQNFRSGKLTDNPLAAAATTINSAELANLPPVAAPDVLAIVLDPRADFGAPEVVLVTAHTASATSATVTRGQESSTARQHPQNTSWQHGPTAADFDAAVIAFTPSGLILSGTDDVAEALEALEDAIVGQQGEVFFDSKTDNQSFTTIADLANLDAASFTVPAGQVYEVEGFAPYTSASVAGAFLTLTIADENGVAKAIGVGANATANNGVTGPCLVRERISSAGSYTRKLRGTGTFGTGSVFAGVAGAALLFTVRRIK